MNMDLQENLKNHINVIIFKHLVYVLKYGKSAK
jgi:hypothetical protein